MVSGEKIQELRRVKGITQHELADLLKVNRSMVAKYEAGTSSMSLETLLALCKVFDVTPNELLGYKVEYRQSESNMLLERNLLAVLADQIKQKDSQIGELEKRIATLMKKVIK